MYLKANTMGYFILELTIESDGYRRGALERVDESILVRTRPAGSSHHEEPAA
jgi:hypothetical protein